MKYLQISESFVEIQVISVAVLLHLKGVNIFYMYILYVL